MKISILLPTRDRLRYLRYAVESVLREHEDEDWELIVSDNDSQEDVAGYVAGLRDERIHYFRTDRLLPVTENWNKALNHSTGEYVLMLGDDDAVLPGYFRTMRGLIERFDRPDVIYHTALLYTYPGVRPDAPAGFLQPSAYASFLKGATQAFRLDRGHARSVVRDAMRFRLRYGFNMQFATFRRAAADALRDGGEFFQSRFPDYYAMNLLFAKSSSIVVEPRPCVVIGVTPQSYGFFHVNKRETEGRAMLEANDEPRARESGELALLPGTNINTGWLLAMEAISARLGASPDFRPSYRRYRLLQIVHTYQAYYVHATGDRQELEELNRHLGLVERMLYTAAARVAKAGTRVLPAPMRRIFRGALDRALMQFPPYKPGRDPREFETVLEVLDRVDPDTYPRSFAG
jgi:hypothetical protein